MNAGIHRKDGIPGGSKYAKAVEGREAEARQKVHRRTLRPDFAQIRERMENAFGGREGKVRGALFHSDQGWQYQRKEFGDILEGYGMVQSMSRKGNCHDNSVMENFFGRLKVEMFYGEEARYSDYGSLKKALRDYIAWYNSSRLKEYLHWKSPQEALSNSGTL